MVSMLTERRTNLLENRLLLEAIEARATDVHIDPLINGYCVRFRIDGVLRVAQRLDRSAGAKLVNQVKADAGIEPGTVFLPVDVRRKWEAAGGEPVDLRISVAPCISGPKVAIRILPLNRVERRIPELGLSETDRTRLERWAAEMNGMIVVSGPPASGKTTTVYGILYEIMNESRHVVTVEDPVEYEIDNINQIQVDEAHGLGFAEGIRATQRLDPDCLVVGEIREAESAERAISAAIRGHAVLATMHSRDAASAVTRFRNFGLRNHQIAAALGVVVNQRLVRRLCSACSEIREASAGDHEFFESRGVRVPDRTGAPKGCRECGETGYRGRTGVFEVWNLEESDYDGILCGRDEKGLREGMRRSNHRSLFEDAADKVCSGVTSVAEIVRAGLDLPWENE